MIERRHLPHAPIREALIDFRINPGDGFALDKVKSLIRRISDRYPECQEMHSQTLEFQVAQGKTTTEKQLAGFRALSRNQRHVAQFRTNGFTFSQLEPYETWEAMRDEAKSLWTDFAELLPTATLSRIATRYINKLKIPLPIDDFSDYFTVAPQLPRSLPQGVSSFLSRVVMHERTLGAACIFTHSLEGSDETFAHFLLDVDVFQNGDFAVDGDAYWERLEQLRHFKNRVFFESITEKCVELFL